MNSKDMVVGKRYMLPDGAGEFLGWEEFTADGMDSRINSDMSLYDYDSDYPSRLRFKIDEDTEWSQIMTSTTYALYKHQFGEIKEL